MKILYLLVDCLRRDFLGCYGSEAVNTPTLDGFSREGMIFDQAVASAPWTPPSTSSMITGIFPHKLGVYTFDTPLPDNVKTLYAYLLENGYKVGSFVFDEEALFSKVPEANVIDNFRDFSKPLDWIRQNKGSDFFLFLHYYWVHGPYTPQTTAESWSSENKELLRLLREDYETGLKKCIQLYTRAVKEMSEVWLNQILTFLKEENILDDTLIILTSDHGESWGERLSDKSELKLNFDLHGSSLYDEVLRVPLIMRYPGIIPENTVVKNQVSHVDLLPTILTLAEIPLDSGDRAPIDGKSLLPMDPSSQNDHVVISSTSSVSESSGAELDIIDKLSVRLPPWKLIWNLGSDSFELYNLKTDPGETTDIKEDYYEVTDELRKLLEKELDSVSPNNLPQNLRERFQIKKKLPKIDLH